MSIVSTLELAWVGGRGTIEGVSGRFHDLGRPGRFAHGSFTSSSGPTPGSAWCRAAERHHPRSSGSNSPTINWSKALETRRGCNFPVSVTVLWCSASKSFRPSKIRRSSAVGHKGEERNRRSNEIESREETTIKLLHNENCAHRPCEIEC